MPILTFQPFDGLLSSWTKILNPPRRTCPETWRCSLLQRTYLTLLTHSDNDDALVFFLLMGKQRLFFCLRTFKCPGFSAWCPLFLFLFLPDRFLFILASELKIQFLREAVTVTATKIVYMLLLYYTALISIWIDVQTTRFVGLFD